MSLKSAIAGSVGKMKKGIKNIEVEPDAGGKGYIATHHYHDFENPKNGMKYVVPHSKLKAHFEKHMPSMGDGDEENEEEE